MSLGRSCRCRVPAVGSQSRFSRGVVSGCTENEVRSQGRRCQGVRSGRMPAVGSGVTRAEVGSVAGSCLSLGRLSGRLLGRSCRWVGHVESCRVRSLGRVGSGRALGCDRSGRVRCHRVGSLGHWVTRAEVGLGQLGCDRSSTS
jgi:hypothetical protein